MTNAEHTPQTAPASSLESPVRIDADHTLTKRLGNWTRARSFEVRTRRGAVVLDLRSPDIADGDLDLHVDIDHGMLKLLVASDTVIDHFGSLKWNGRGRVKDLEGASGSEGRRIHVTGQITSGEIRIHRNGIAILSSMFSRAFVQDALRARREGGFTTVDDPTRTAS
ncbi:hypothetical protein QMK19_26455 [Streptomyces sp. H10-C2]|uniref:hypothetical protein n=1 Tax=unclassified Streptomyces TaxID=2593676 RepID=UPI0024B9E001|nr:MULTISPECIES: hypothetical protein [unclassified Streptomyces]MDJ0343647.1 hypothetical protein [Streptomyces sp. PH10-H1]MDJ0373105.1 hypothetical protein [Streptomyces sp. H10-C2]